MFTLTRPDWMVALVIERSIRRSRRCQLLARFMIGSFATDTRTGGWIPACGRV